MSDYFDRVERQLVERVPPGLPRRSRFPGRIDQLAIAASLLVVIAVGAVFVSTRGPSSTVSSGAHRGVRIVFSVSPLDPRTPLGPSIVRSITILRERLDSVFHGVRVSVAGGNVVVDVRAAAGASRARIVALAAPGRLEFYDWEASALTPNGRTVASQLRRQDPVAMLISQGSGSAASGQPGAGGLPLYETIKLAARQPPRQSADSAGPGPQYYLFGAPGSVACQTVARGRGELPVAGTRCLLSGPASTPQALDASLPPGVSASQGKRLVVPRGIVLLQAEGVTAASTPRFSSPVARFFVLENHAALSGADITNPRASTDQAGTPDVTFGFGSAGAKKFQKVTSTIAHRGALESPFHQQLNQHFAVALDNQLVTVPQIDFKQYPDGITGGGGADITGSFTIQSARTLATLLRYPPLPVELTAR